MERAAVVDGHALRAHIADDASPVAHGDGPRRDDVAFDVAADGQSTGAHWRVDDGVLSDVHVPGELEAALEPSVDRQIAFAGELAAHDEAWSEVAERLLNHGRSVRWKRRSGKGRSGGHGDFGTRTRAEESAVHVSCARERVIVSAPVSTKKKWGSTVLGWFVVKEGDAEAQGNEPVTAAGADALIEKYAAAAAAPDAPAGLPPGSPSQPIPPFVGGALDFIAVYESAGVDAEERDRVSKARDLLRSLPVDTPAATKKQIVEASLRAFGVPTEKIIEAGVASIEALESHVRAGQADTQKLLGESTQRIAQLEQEIGEVRGIMEQAVREQQARMSAVNNEKLGVQQVLEFFGQEAVAKVVRDSPKLHEPG